MLLQLVVWATAILWVLAVEPEPDRYSSCFADRGYTEQDSLAAATFLWQNLTFSTGRHLSKKECVYKNINTTIVSLCNGEARNRTVYRDEVKRGIDQLILDCGADGSFSGYHIVNNLTFAAYGIMGGAKPIPQGGNPPDLPGGKAERNIANSPRDGSGPDPTDPCEIAWSFDGKDRYDCLRKKGHDLNPDGSCGTPSPENQCQVYCEVRRTGYLELERNGPGNFGQRSAVATNLENGQETTISSGFSIGVEGILKETIGAGVSYAWSISQTTVKSVQQNGVAPPVNVFARWVFFPQYIQTCGSVSRRTYNPLLPCTYQNCAGSTLATGSCTGELETFGNQCSSTPHLSEGQPTVDWAVRFEDQAGKPLPIDQQPASYQTLCDKNAGDPDYDSHKECNSY